MVFSLRRRICFPAGVTRTGGVFAALFDRPTVLEGGERGFAAWIRMFGSFALSAVRPAQRAEASRRWQDLARMKLFRNGAWTLDYRRLRMLAVKV